MRTKPIWVYLIDDSMGGSPMAFVCYQTARKEQKSDRDYGYSVSPIVRVEVPLPARDEGGKR